MTEGTPELEPVLAALRLLGQVRYSRDPRLGAAVSLLSSPHFRLASSATGSASAPCPIDVSHLLDTGFEIATGDTKNMTTMKVVIFSVWSVLDSNQ